QDQLALWRDRPRFPDIRCDIVAGVSTVRAHGVLLGELLNVLLDNACRYSPAQTAIVIRLTPTGERVQLEVIDQGYGIAESELPTIFAPFCRLSNAVRINKSGLGLGLAIAWRLARSFGATLAVESQLNRGSRFTLTFPA